MKKILLAVFPLLIILQSFSYRSFPINTKVLETFQSTFPDAEHVQWSESTDQYAVSFVDHGIFTRITFTKNGEFIGSFRNYSERNLPYYILNLLKLKFPGDKIFGVTEIAAPSAISYYVKLEGPKLWKTVRVDGDGFTSVVEKYQKMP
ncbi:MAG TPA: hypothetical protein VL832_14400 [Puia sp.]|jgi:hypothetical protein|nr:hypothetical protein [Puia sp.]